MLRTCHTRPAISAMAGLVLVAGLATALTPGVAGAAVRSFTVNTTTDGHDMTPGNGVCAAATGKCTLRAAIEEADAQSAGSTTSIVVPAGTYKLTLGSLGISRGTVRITGVSAATTKVLGTVVGQVVGVSAGVSATLAQVTIAGGKAGGKAGGGITNSGTLSLVNAVVDHNTAAHGGGITNTAGGHLTLTSTTVSANTAASGLDSKPGGGGGGIYNQGTFTLTGSTISGNDAGSGGLGINDTGGSGGNGQHHQQELRRLGWSRNPAAPGSGWQRGWHLLVCGIGHPVRDGRLRQHLRIRGGGRNRGRTGERR
jgi:CSLREA domain-containing protein